MVDTERDPLELLTMPELCQLLKISRYQAYDEIKAGRLPAYRLGEGGRQWRFRRQDVEAYLIGSKPCSEKDENRKPMSRTHLRSGTTPD